MRKNIQFVYDNKFILRLYLYVCTYVYDRGVEINNKKQQ